MFLFPFPANPTTELAVSAPTLRREKLSLEQSSGTPTKPNTFWILGPFGVEHQLDTKSSLGAYLSLVSKDDDSNGSTIALGLAAEYLQFSAEGARGFAYGARAFVGSGFAIGPSLFYVTRPAGNGVAFRIGATFPIGDKVVPFYPELGIGFRF